MLSDAASQRYFERSANCNIGRWRWAVMNSVMRGCFAVYHRCYPQLLLSGKKHCCHIIAVKLLLKGNDSEAESMRHNTETFIFSNALAECLQLFIKRQVGKHWRTTSMSCSIEFCGIKRMVLFGNELLLCSSKYGMLIRISSHFTGSVLSVVLFSPMFVSHRKQ